MMLWGRNGAVDNPRALWKLGPERRYYGSHGKETTIRLSSTLSKFDRIAPVLAPLSGFLVVDPIVDVSGNAARPCLLERHSRNRRNAIDAVRRYTQLYHLIWPKPRVRSTHWCG
jgi:hypothetical protein